MIQVEDDGVGMSAPPAVAAAQMGSGRGIGMVNVAERLHVLFGDEGRLTVQSRDGHGTLVMLEMPVLNTELPPAGAAAAIYAARSNTALIESFIFQDDLGGAKPGLRFQRATFPISRSRFSSERMSIA